MPRIVPLPEKIKQIAGGRYSLSLSGNIYHYNKKIDDKQEYTQITGDLNYVIATNKNGELFLRGQCANYNTDKLEKIYDMDNITSVAGGYNHFLVSKSNGNVKFCGNILNVTYNNELSLDVGNIKVVKKITCCGDYSFFGKRRSDKGRDIIAKKVRKLKISNVKDMVGSFYGTIVLTNDNKIKEAEKNYILKNLNVSGLEM